MAEIREHLLAVPYNTTSPWSGLINKPQEQIFETFIKQLYQDGRHPGVAIRDARGIGEQCR